MDKNAKLFRHHSFRLLQTPAPTAQPYLILLYFLCDCKGYKLDYTQLNSNSYHNQMQIQITGFAKPESSNFTSA